MLSCLGWVTVVYTRAYLFFTQEQRGEVAGYGKFIEKV